MDKCTRVADQALVFLAGDKPHQVQSMAAQIAQSAGTGQFLLKTPAKRRLKEGQAPSLVILHIHMVDLSDHPAVDQVLGVTR